MNCFAENKSCFLYHLTNLIINNSKLNDEYQAVMLKLLQSLNRYYLSIQKNSRINL